MADAHAPTVACDRSYRVWRSNFRVLATDGAVIGSLDRLCHQFAAECREGATRIEIRELPDGRRGVWWDGRLVARRRTALGAARHVEWRMVRRAARAERDLVHLHAAALERDGRVTLIPGPTGSGKSSLALALSARGFRLLGEDVVFLDPDRGLVHPFARAPHLREGTVELLAEAGLCIDPARLLPGFAEVEAVPAWGDAPGRLDRVVLLERGTGPARLNAITHAEAALALQRSSYNLAGRERSGWSELALALAGVTCLRLEIGEGLHEAARLLAQGRRSP